MKFEWLAPAPPPVESPCIGVCTLDDDGNCMGCHRSTDEIAGWTSMTDDERRAVMERVEARALGQ
ncbi:MAG: DUF1289 domain-containing protein [Pseudomonadota bacterium]